MPGECNEDDVVKAVNFLLEKATSSIGPIAVLVPPLETLTKMRVEPGICRTAKDPVPTLDPWMIAFFVFLAIIGVLTILGTAFDYFVLRVGVLPAAKGGIKLAPMNDAGAGGAVNGEEKDAAVECGVENGGAASEGAKMNTEKRRKQLNPLFKFLMCFSMV